jgi:hypothetical protein
VGDVWVRYWFAAALSLVSAATRVPRVRPAAGLRTSRAVRAAALLQVAATVVVLLWRMQWHRPAQLLHRILDALLGVRVRFGGEGVGAQGTSRA